MDLSELDKMMAARENRITKRKDEGSLFEEEFKGKESEDARLESEIEQQKQAMKEKMDANIPDCPQCGVKMTFIPEQSMVACEGCGVGMRV